MADNGHRDPYTNCSRGLSWPPNIHIILDLYDRLAHPLPQAMEPEEMAGDRRVVAFRCNDITNARLP